MHTKTLIVLAPFVLASVFFLLPQPQAHASYEYYWSSAPLQTMPNFNGSGTYVTALKNDAYNNGSACYGGHCGLFNPYGFDPQYPYYGTSDGGGYPDGIWGCSGSTGGCNYSQPTANRLCQIVSAAQLSAAGLDAVDTNVVAENLSFNKFGSIDNNNTLIYTGSSWDRLEDLRHYSLLGGAQGFNGGLGNNGSYVLDGFYCYSNSPPYQSLTVDKTSVTAGQPATLTFNANNISWPSRTDLFGNKLVDTADWRVLL